MSENCENAVSCDCQGVFRVAPPNPPPPPPVYWNTQQCATAICPSGLDGDSVEVCVDANLYSSTTSQSDADSQAFQAALSQANAQLNCGLAGQLSGLLWEMPCTNGSNPCSCSNPSDQTATAQGNTGQTYTVQLRIRGVVECKPYALYGVGGTANNYVFTCSDPTQAVPAAGSHGDNEYCLTISNPPATIFLNNAPTNVAPTAVEKFDYQLTVQITTGATVTLKARSIDNLQWANHASLVVGNPPPAIGVSEPYNGEFIQMDVVSIL